MSESTFNRFWRLLDEALEAEADPGATDAEAHNYSNLPPYEAAGLIIRERIIMAMIELALTQMEMRDVDML